MVFKLVEATQKNWRRLDDHNQLPKLFLGVKFADGSRWSQSRPISQPTTRAAWRPIRPSLKIGGSS
jgi:hypothetical protein